MLLFSSNSFLVNGITVFPDHADASQFWYLPGPVGLETMAGSTDPQFLLIEYAPDVAAAGIQGTGFLNVTLSLTLSPDNQEAIMGKIRSQFPKVANPLLSPVTFDQGTVQIVALNLQGSGGTAAAGGGAGQAVQTILGASNPELFGNNDALFALTLSEEGATILEQAFQDGMTPVGGIYNMTFTGVQPALDVKITADLKRVYQSFSVDLTVQFYAQVGIDATFEKLRQDGAIQIEVVNLTTDTSGTDRETWALNLFKDQIMAQWFTPSLSPTTEQAADAQSVNLSTGAGTGTTKPAPTPAPTPPPKTTTGMGSGGSSSGMTNPSQPSNGMSSAGGASGGTTVTSGAAQVATGVASVASGASTIASGAAGVVSGATGQKPAAPPSTPTLPSAPASPSTPASGGSSSAVKSLPGTAAAASQAASPFGASLKLKFVSQDELKTVEYEFNQMSAVQRTYSPQGYFGLLLQGLDQSKHFLKVDGTDPFFNKFVVTINPPRDFAGIGLLVAHVALDYGDPSSAAGVKHGEFSFDPTTQTTQTWDVFEGLIQSTQFNYTADYKFDPESGWVGELTEYPLPTVTTENRVLNLDPYDFLGFLQVSVSADRIDPTLVDRIEVPLQYTSASGWQTSTTIIVRAGTAPQVWKLRLADKNLNTYSYATNCYLKDGTLISTPRVSSSASAIIVSDPFGSAINLTLQPAFNPTAYSVAIVELSYQDIADKYSFQTSVQIQAGTTTPPTVRIPLIDPAINSYQYRFTFITTANQQQQGSYITATDPLVVVASGS